MSAVVSCLDALRRYGCIPCLSFVIQLIRSLNVGPRHQLPLPPRSFAGSRLGSAAAPRRAEARQQMRQCPPPHQLGHLHLHLLAGLAPERDLAPILRRERHSPPSLPDPVGRMMPQPDPSSEGVGDCSRDSHGTLLCGTASAVRLIPLMAAARPARSQDRPSAGRESGRESERQLRWDVPWPPLDEVAQNAAVVVVVRMVSQKDAGSRERCLPMERVHAHLPLLAQTLLVLVLMAHMDASTMFGLSRRVCKRWRRSGLAASTSH
jgi:hypothetical protein